MYTLPRMSLSPSPYHVMRREHDTECYICTESKDTSDAYACVGCTAVAHTTCLARAWFAATYPTTSHAMVDAVAAADGVDIQPECGVCRKHMAPKGEALHVRARVASVSYRWPGFWPLFYVFACLCFFASAPRIDDPHRNPIGYTFANMYMISIYTVGMLPVPWPFCPDMPLLSRAHFSIGPFIHYIISLFLRDPHTWWAWFPPAAWVFAWFYVYAHRGRTWLSSSPMPWRHMAAYLLVCVSPQLIWPDYAQWFDALLTRACLIATSMRLVTNRVRLSHWQMVITRATTTKKDNVNDGDM